MKTLQIDFGSVVTLADMHALLKATFGFPEFYGNNVNALIDCLSDLRYPEYGMSKFHLDSLDDVLLLEIKNLPNRDPLIINHFLTAIQGVHDKNLYADRTPSIHLILL